jgi:fucose permease
LRTSGQPFRNLHENPLLRRLVAAQVLMFGAGETAFQLQPAFVNTLWPTWGVGVMRTAANGSAFASFIASGRLIRRFGPTRTLLAGTLWAQILNIAALLKPTVVSPSLIAAESAAYGSGSTAQNALQQSEFTDRERATMGSLVALLGSLVFGVISLSAGAITDRFGLRVGLLSCQAIGLIGLPLLWSVHHHHKHRSPA